LDLIIWIPDQVWDDKREMDPRSPLRYARDDEMMLLLEKKGIFEKNKITQKNLLK